VLFQPSKTTISQIINFSKTRVLSEKTPKKRHLSTQRKEKESKEKESKSLSLRSKREMRARALPF
ncbi:hypothetical protein, partial [Parabacteroides johnsonii]|jgi:hypothetical protein|uniref:hypothetical protein n=1 Tax=Parabacteroides johnsonii TaxID=387661 RepID=UPI002430466E